jgi:uncharacterized membrane protein YgaE (UPF0421/DUF939 family)
MDNLWNLQEDCYYNDKTFERRSLSKKKKTFERRRIYALDFRRMYRYSSKIFGP